MFNIIPIVLILLSLCAIIAVVVRKFPALANLDIDTIQTEKEAKFKEQIISNRVKRDVIKYKNKLVNILSPIGRGLKNNFSLLYDKLLSLKDVYSKREQAQAEDIPARISELFSEAEKFIKEEDFDKAEDKYIEIISLDSRNLKAFKALGRTLVEKKNYSEAIQTLEHALKLQDDYEAALPGQAADPVDKSMEAAREDAGNFELERSKLNYNLALAHKLNENIDESLKSLKNALRLEPKNPRYLDTMIEICIMNKDKILALDAYEKLFRANPDNKKLEEFKKQIDKL